MNFKRDKVWILTGLSWIQWSPMLCFAKYAKFVPYEQRMSWSIKPCCPETYIPCGAYLHVSLNGNFSVRASISIPKMKAKFTWNINKLHCQVAKMFTVNNSNYHLITRLWSVSLPKRAMSHSKYWHIQGWMQVFTTLCEGYTCCLNPNNQTLSAHLQRSTSFLLPWFSPKFDVCVTMHHWYNNTNSELDAIKIVLITISISSTCFGQ